MGDHFGMSKYMVDPNNIQLEAEINQGEMNQQTIGFIVDGCFYFYSLSCGYGAVANAIRYKQGEGKFRYYAESMKNSAEETVQIIRRKTQSAISLAAILEDAGFEAVEEDADIDLTQLDRSTMIELFSNN